MYNIKKYDNVAEAGASIFSADKYKLTETCDNPDGILVHSTPLHHIALNPELKSIVRIGAGVNTIPVDRCTENGVAVFNCPGGNANAVKELTIAAMIMAMRNGVKAMNWVKSLPEGEEDAGKKVEKGKEVFRGPEIMGKTLGVLALGNVGYRVAKAAHDLGMKVIGYDPYLTHQRRQEISAYCEIVDDINIIYQQSDVISVHTPLNDETRGMVGAKEIAMMKDGVYLVNYARGPILDNDAVADAIESGKIQAFATDFPTPRQMRMENVVFTPHLGAGTPEADINCSIMAAHQTIDYIENGNIVNSVNLPNVSYPRADGARICIIHKNIVGMLGKITDKISAAGLNIENLINKGRDSVAYTMLDFNTAAPEALKAELESIEGVIRVRIIE